MNDILSVEVCALKASKANADILFAYNHFESPWKRTHCEWWTYEITCFGTLGWTATSWSCS